MVCEVEKLTVGEGEALEETLRVGIRE